MTEDRETELLRKIPMLTCTGELDGFRDYLQGQGEALTGRLMAALGEMEGKLKPKQKRRK